MYVRDKVPENEIKQVNVTNSVECILTEINVGKKMGTDKCLSPSFSMREAFP